MHLLEVFIYILTILIITIILNKKPIKKRYVVSLFSVVLILLILHIFIVGIRWQLYTLYLAVFILGVIVFIKAVINIKLRTFIKRSILIVLIGFIAISALSTFAFPIYEVPLPSGNYLIGTESFVIKDENRVELYSENSNDFRKIKIQMWYPAELTKGYEQAPWIEDGLVVIRALSKDVGLPFFALDHTVKVMSNSYLNAPISKALDNYPVIIISHGWRGFRDLHIDYAEELASLGYIVIGIDHTYGSIATVFNDEDIAYVNLGALPNREETLDYLDYANQLVNTYAFDISTTINYLEDINDSNYGSRFSEKLDLTKIGLLGHSTGGGAGVAIALEDDRIDALIGLDAWVEPIDELKINKGLEIPSIFLRSQVWEIGYNNINLYALIENSISPSVLYQIEGTTHYDFAMVYMYSPLTKFINITGSVDSKYLNSILKSMISDFFDKTLRDDTNSEIDIDIWKEVRNIPTK